MNVGSKSEVRNVDGYTPLHLAAEYGFSTALQELVEREVQIPTPRCVGETTPLYSAAAHGHVGATRVCSPPRRR